MKKLERSEMKNLIGGKNEYPSCQGWVEQGGSCWHNADWSDGGCGLTQAQAIAHGAMWCTASCASSCANSNSY